jgi:hypothetical protein
MILRRIFGLTLPVDRRFYAITGIVLALAKYAIDAGLVYAVTGKVWSPLNYLSPILSLRERGLEAEALVTAIAVWTLPFMWIGASMSIRRALNAGYSGWLGLLFFVPGIHYFLMIFLALAPSAPEVAARSADMGRPPPVDDRISSALLGVAVGLGISLGMMGLSVYVLGAYGSGLFAATPFIIGAASGYLFNRRVKRSVNGTMIAALAAIFVSGGAILLLALEGVVCLAMAMPLAGVMAILGALAGRAIAVGKGTPRPPALAVLLALPILTGAEAASERAPLREVLSTIEVDAPPSRVWTNVIGFSELPPPGEVLFNLGIAYPLRAKIFGSGVGAVRHCEFSTGPFVEPITVWEPPERLGFDVRAQPPSMKEWSPYRHVMAPHLDGYLRSKRGEFHLVPIGGERTRIEARTWYEVDIFPDAYWAIYSDALIGAIHHRVLAHVKALSEHPSRSSP